MGIFTKLFGGATMNAEAESAKARNASAAAAVAEAPPAQAEPAHAAPADAKPPIGFPAAPPAGPAAAPAAGNLSSEPPKAAAAPIAGAAASPAAAPPEAAAAPNIETPPSPAGPPRAPDGHEGLAKPREGEPEGLRQSIVDVMRTVFDPEIPVNIFELGLIYNLDIAPDGQVGVRMTLTAPNCPAAGTLPGEVEAKVRGVKGVAGVKLELVWEPTWNMGFLSEAARLELGF